MAKKFVRFEPDELERARQMSTVDVISSCRGYSFHRAGSEYACDEHSSLRVYRDGRGWSWYSQGLSGTTAIDWLTKAENMNFTDAVSRLLGRSAERISYEQVDRASLPQKPKEIELPPKAQGPYSRVIAYLTQTRCIAPEVVSWCIKNNLIYQDDRGNCVFCGLDNDGNVKYASKRGTLTTLKPGQKPYKGDCPGSNKTYGFVMQGTVKEHIYVFEAPIDALSHATFNNIKSKHLGDAQPQTAFMRHTRIALGGVSDNALQRYLVENPDVNEISFCLDNDEAGRTASETFAKKLGDKYKCNIYTIPESRGKDYNEWLQQASAKLQPQKQQSIKQRSR